MEKISRLFFDRPARHLLFLAAILQLTVVLGLYTTGRIGVSPKRIDERGLLIAALRDTTDYDRGANKALETLKHSGIRAWMISGYDAHIKIYSLSYFVFGPLVGKNILSAEPFNLSCYLAILIAVFKIGKEVFDEAVGRASAAAVAVWPSFLLHNTQLLKDPICVLAMLILVLVMALWLTRELSWRRGLLTGLLGGTAIVLIHTTRARFWGLVILGVIMIGAGLFVVRQVRERSLLAGNALSILVVVLLAVTALSINRSFVSPGEPPAEPADIIENNDQSSALPDQEKLSQAKTAASPSPVVQSDGERRPIPSVSKYRDRNHLVILIQQVRDAFAWKYKTSGTLIDSDVEFVSVASVLLYLPRAMEIGFLAPFPNAWLAQGKEVGFTGRLLSGAEMLAAYVLELFALFGIWRGRHRLSMWLVACTVLFGVTTLALGLINVGALYRMRYPFFVLLIVLGMHGLFQIRQGIRERSVTKESQLTPA